MQLHYVLVMFQKIFVADNMKKTGLYGYVYGFSVYYNSIYVSHFLHINKYLMVKNNIK